MKTKRKSLSPLPVLVAIAAVLFVTILIFDRPQPEPEAVPEETVPVETQPVYATPSMPAQRLAVFAQMQGLSLDFWPEDMIELLNKNPDAEEYVFNYPIFKGTEREADLSSLVGTGEVPKLYQWDFRWGYSQYGDKELGLTGCGPTCLSMACLYFLEDAKYTPRYVADFAEDNDYYEIGYGSKWTLMSEGAEALGLDSEATYVDANWFMQNLEAGNLLILSMGPGIFTESGHFILLTGVKDGMVMINDPNSKTNSEKLWDVETFLDEIDNVWIISKPQA